MTTRRMVLAGLVALPAVAGLPGPVLGKEAALEGVELRPGQVLAGRLAKDGVVLDPGRIYTLPEFRGNVREIVGAIRRRALELFPDEPTDGFADEEAAASVAKTAAEMDPEWGSLVTCCFLVDRRAPEWPAGMAQDPKWYYDSGRIGPPLVHSDIFQ